MRSNSYAVLVLLFLVVEDVCSCGPGRGAGRRRRPHKLTPLVYKQHIPNVSENTLGASGPPEKRGPIRRGDNRFKDLVANWNSNIVFKDEENTNSDRMMTRRLREKLNYLAISVRNQWPDVKLRVTEAWDEDNQHADDSLHYQGRAADITTSDRDRAKYGMLARLAVEAGFDWVYYESRGHVHCSVKSDDSAAIRNGGCFPATSKVTTPEGDKFLSELVVGDRVLVQSSKNTLEYSETMLFLDRSANETSLYYHITTKRGRILTLTPGHLIYVFKSSSRTLSTVYAGEVEVGDRVMTVSSNGSRLEEDEVERITQSVETGLYAPLTKEGNIIIDKTLTSCYAVVNSQSLAQWSFLPVRLFHYFQPDNVTQTGRYWYAQILYDLAQQILPKSLLLDT